LKLRYQVYQVQLPYAKQVCRAMHDTPYKQELLRQGSG
jgi:hypothetical protein